MYVCMYVHTHTHTHTHIHTCIYTHMGEIETSNKDFGVVHHVTEVEFVSGQKYPHIVLARPKD